MAKNIKWIICDIDGTVSDKSHRDHILDGKVGGGDEENREIDWDAYLREGWKDPPIMPIVQLVRYLSLSVRIAFVTGRNDKFRLMTERWLSTYFPFMPYELYMRPEGNWNHDYEIKWDIYMAHFVGRNLLFVLEDRQQCVDMWRRSGITCLQPRVEK